MDDRVLFRKLVQEFVEVGNNRAPKDYYIPLVSALYYAKKRWYGSWYPTSGQSYIHRFARETVSPS